MTDADWRLLIDDWAGLRDRRDAYVRRLNDIYERNLVNAGVRVVRGRARLTGARHVSVPGEVLEGRLDTKLVPKLLGLAERELLDRRLVERRRLAGERQQHQE